jgi:TolB protein
MKNRNLKTIVTITIGLVLAMLAVASCAPPGMGRESEAEEPTITAIMLPTRIPTEEPARQATREQTAESDDTATIAETVAVAAGADTAAVSDTSVTSEVDPSDTAPEDESDSSETGSADVTEPPDDTDSAEIKPTATTSPLPPTPEPAAEQTAKPLPKTTKPKASPEFMGKLAFQTSSGGDIYTINADGTNLQRVTDGVDPAWSPDGEQIALTRWREPRGVWAVSPNSTGAAAAEQHLFTWNEARWPSWSPSGEQIIFSRQDGGRMEERERCFRGMCFTIPARPHWKLGIVNAADGSFVEPPGPDVAQAPDWSPDGASIVYDGEQGIWVQTLDGETAYPITDNARDTTPVWSPDGSRVAFTRMQHDHWEIYVVNSGGGNVTRLTTTPKRPDGAPGNSAAATWSPDGKHLAFLTDRSGEWEIWVMNANGKTQKPMFATALDGGLTGLTLEYASLSERALSWTE